MRIARVDLHWVKMPLIYPWRTAYGEDWDIHTVLVRLQTPEGLHAWGETTPLHAPTYSPEHTPGVYTTLKEHFAPAVVGQEFDSADELLSRLAAFKGNPFAKAGLEVAWWVLEAKRQGVPLRALLGGSRDSVPVGADFGVQDSLDMLIAKIQTAIDAGYPRVKLKFRPGWDVNMLDAVRSTFPTQVFHIDCNSGYTLADADLFRKVDRYRLAMIEQPLAYDDLIDHAALQRMIETPVCLDESIKCLRDAELALRLGSCRYVNIKMGRVGGLSAAKAIHDLCAAQGIPCWVGGMLESAIGGAICLELATLSNFVYPSDIFPSSTYYRRDVGQPELVLNGPGEMAASSVPGIRPEPDPELLAAQTVARVAFEA
jgi:O-succinylbenzoate synthase